MAVDQEHGQVITNEFSSVNPGVPEGERSGNHKKLFLIAVTLLLILTTGATVYYAFTNRKNTAVQTTDTTNQTAPSKSPFSTGFASTTVSESPTPDLPIVFESPERTTRVVNPVISPDAVKNSQSQSLYRPSSNNLPTVVLASSKTLSLNKASAEKVLGEATPSSDVKIYRINSFILNIDQAKNLADKFGFSGEPERAGPNASFPTFHWANPKETFLVDGRYYLYQAAAETGDLPSGEEAVVTAAKFLRDKGLYAGEIVRALPQKKTIELFANGADKSQPGHGSSLPTIMVKFLKAKDSIPIVYGSLDAEDSTDLEVAVGPGNKVVMASDQSAGYVIDSQDPVDSNLKDLTESVEEFKATGGALRWITMKPGESFSPGVGKYEIRNSLITKIYLACLFGSGIGATDFAKETVIRNTGYLIPVWVFVGRGQIYGGNYSGTTVDFASSTYAFKQTGGQLPVIGFRSLTLDKSEARPEAIVSASFNFVYVNLKGDQYQNYFPPVGLRYKLMVTYPNGSTKEAEGVIRDPVYGETAWLYTGTNEGEMVIKVNLIDFPEIYEERTVKISNTATQVSDATLIGGVYKSYTGEPVLGVKVILKSKSDNKVYEVKNDAKGEFRIESLSVGKYEVSAVSADGQVLKSEEMEILSRDQNLVKFERAENYINIGVD